MWGYIHSIVDAIVGKYLISLRNIRHLNKFLAILLVVLFMATTAASTYLSRTLLDARTLLQNGSNSADGAMDVQALEFNLLAATATERGYVMTGDPAYLQQYYRSIEPIPALQKELTKKDYGINAKKLEILESLVNQRLNELKQNVELYNSGQHSAAKKTVASRQGLNLTISLQKIGESIRNDEIKPFKPAFQNTQQSLTRAFIVAIVMVGIVLIICLVIVWYFHKALQREHYTENVKNEFLSLASHQLRTPATNVKQYIALLLEGHLGKLTPKQREALRIADSNNETGIGIINGLLDVAKLDLDQIDLDKKQLNLYKLSKEVADSYRPIARKRSQTIKFDHPDKKVRVSADTIYMRGVIENLIDNASKYSPKKTHIIIKITHPPKKAILSITDEGVGIKKTDTNKLFKKFSRIPNELSDSVNATGLGLYWVKQVVEQHGGCVGVKSRPGKGSTFRIELPAS